MTARVGHTTCQPETNNQLTVYKAANSSTVPPAGARGHSRWNVSSLRSATRLVGGAAVVTSLLLTVTGLAYAQDSPAAPGIPFRYWFKGPFCYWEGRLIPCTALHGIVNIFTFPYIESINEQIRQIAETLLTEGWTWNGSEWVPPAGGSTSGPGPGPTPEPSPSPGQQQAPVPSRMPQFVAPEWRTRGDRAPCNVLPLSRSSAITQAVFTVFADVVRRPDSNQREYAGIIYRTNGTYSHSTPRPGLLGDRFSDDGLFEWIRDHPDCPPVGSYHSHWAFPGGEPEVFSDRDIETAIARCEGWGVCIPTFMLTVDRAIRRYDPPTGGSLGRQYYFDVFSWSWKRGGP